CRRCRHCRTKIPGVRCANNRADPRRAGPLAPNRIHAGARKGAESSLGSALRGNCWWPGRARFAWLLHGAAWKLPGSCLGPAWELIESDLRVACRLVGPLLVGGKSDAT